MIGQQPAICGGPQEMRILSLVCHPQRNKISPLSCQSRVALYAYTFGVHAYDTHVSHIVQSSNKPCSHTLCALSRSLVRLLTRSLAASGFEISAAVVDVRCPRSDRGPGTRREPRRDRVQDRSIAQHRRNRRSPHLDRENPLD